MSAQPGLTIGFIQFVLALSWTAYAIYLPQLAAQAGLAAVVVPWLLAADQAIFAVSDWMSGAHADRVLARARRLVPILLVATLVSTSAFALLPWAAPALGATALLTLTLIWVASTAALRAPAMALLVQYVPPPGRPALAASVAVGIAVAGAVAPYLARQLRGVDPRWPFALAAGGVMIAALGLWLAERRLQRGPATSLPADGIGPRPLVFDSMRTLALVAGLLALGFQAQVLLLPAQLGRAGASIENFMPVFWGAFGLAAAVGPFALARIDARPIMIAAGLAAAVGAALASLGAGVAATVGGHAVAGLGWGMMLAGLFAVTVAEATGSTAGRIAAIVFGALAAAAFVRIAATAAGWPRSGVLGPGIAWSSSLAWLLGALAVALFASNAASRAGDRS